MKVFITGRTYLTHETIRRISQKYGVEFVSDIAESFSFGVIPDYYIIGPGPNKTSLMLLKRLNVTRVTLEEFFKLLTLETKQSQSKAKP